MPVHARRMLVLLGVVLGASGSSRAAAYCQTTTTDPPTVAACPGPCVTTGYPLAWRNPNIEYVFNQEGFSGLEMTTVRDVFEEIFGTWEAVKCDEEPIGFNITARDSLTSMTVGHDLKQENENVISLLSPEVWRDLKNDPSAFALTAIWYDTNSGEILGADMHFSAAMGPFGVCPDQGCSGNRVADLPNVATHEAGHFLGLAHSEVASATMWCDAQAGQTDKRDLAEDDIDGICAAYPPGYAFTADRFPQRMTQETRSRAGCGCRVGPSRRAGYHELAGVAVFALGLVLRRRRRTLRR